MTTGFVLSRRVTSDMTDGYWKECYRCIRRFYPDAPILIIDDASDPAFLKEDIVLEKCTVIYDKRYKGAAEMLPYYYFWLLRPFDTAVVLHDSVFLQSPVSLELQEGENIRFLWNIPHTFDDELHDLIRSLCTGLPSEHALSSLLPSYSQWMGCFGMMSVIRLSFIHTLETDHALFSVLLPRCTSRSERHLMERIFAIMAYHSDPSIRSAFFGDIFGYLRWGVTYTEYKTQDFSSYPVMKVWSGR